MITHRLIIHNLHGASRSGEFHFFESLQDIDRSKVPILLPFSADVGNGADTVFPVMDYRNTYLIYLYEDCFIYVYADVAKWRSNITVSEQE